MRFFTAPPAPRSNLKEMKFDGFWFSRFERGAGFSLENRHEPRYLPVASDQVGLGPGRVGSWPGWLGVAPELRQKPLGPCARGFPEASWKVRPEPFQKLLEPWRFWKLGPEAYQHEPTLKEGTIQTELKKPCKKPCKKTKKNKVA